MKMTLDFCQVADIFCKMDKNRRSICKLNADFAQLPKG